MIFALSWHRGESNFRVRFGCFSPSLVSIHLPEGPVMIWETPTAVDLRFGMEITMYIAHR
ncbi:MAG: pyrroloquinoline quinone precursor peptide PqqA [Gammaproteobacteria bacterium]